MQPTRVRAEEERKNLTTGEYRLKERTKRTLPKERLWRAIDQAASDQPSMSLLVARLRAEDISVQLRRQENRTSGISYEVDGVAFPGYKLGKAYSFKWPPKTPWRQLPAGARSALNELSRMSPQEIKPLVAEQQAHQQHYNQLYQRYRLTKNLTPEQHDRVVLRRALTDGFEPSEAAAIISWSGEQTAAIRRSQGKDAAETYVSDLAQDELAWVRRQQQAKERDRGLER